MNANLLTDALLLPFFWAGVYFFVVSTGCFFLPRTRNGRLSTDYFTPFWYGLAIVVIFLQLWSFFLPVTLYCWIALLPFALPGSVKMLKRHAWQGIGRPGIIAVALLFLVLLFLVTSSLDNTFIYDSRVYHFYNIEWFNSYPIVPGMGNLFSYLAVNQSYFLFSAFLNGAWGFNKGACATNGLLTIAICFEIILRNIRPGLKNRQLSFAAIFDLLFLPLCINAGVQNLSSPTPDVFVNLFTFKVFSDIFRCMAEGNIHREDFALLLIYCGLGVAMKLSFIGVAIGIVIFLVVTARKQQSLTVLFTGRIFAMLALLIIPWIARGAISSGYIGFPLKTFGLPVDWKMPLSAVTGFGDYVKGFARTHLHGMAGVSAAHGWQWIPAWSLRMLKTFGFIVPVFLFLASAAVIAVKKMGTAALLSLLIPVFICLVIWFFLAPDVRFAGFTFWTLGLAPVAWLLSRLRFRVMYFFNLMIALCAIIMMARNVNTEPAALGDLPKQPFTVFKTRSGLKINVVEDTVHNDKWLMGSCPIPCSADPDSGITLRGKNIRSGFKIIPSDH